jgi:murein L,D-transpeptidase YafK
MTPTPTTAGQTKRLTVADRLQQYGPHARARWQPFFSAKGMSYPPTRVTLAAFKREKLLRVYAAGANGPLRFVRSYPILAASGVIGPKLREGDKQVPEGIYPVETLNPNSRFHLALRVGYPNEFDREQARLDARTNLGGDIMIHGSDVSVGCLAIGNEAAEDLFVLAADAGVGNVTVIISPYDFRQGGGLKELTNLPPWIGKLYDAIKARVYELPPDA